MADAVTTTVLAENKNVYEIILTNKSDGTGESAVLKVDVSALTPAAAEVWLTDVEYATAGMSVELYWDADTDVPFLFIPPDQHGRFDFRESFRGCVENSSGAGKTGDVKLTTVGHTAGDTYWIRLRFKKLQTAEV